MNVGYKQRVKNVFNKLPDDCEAVFILNDSKLDKNFLYITGLTGSDFNYCGILADREGKVTLFTQSLDEELCRTKGFYTEIQVWRGPGIPKRTYEETLKKISTQYKTIGFNYDFFYYSTFKSLKKKIPKVKWIDTSKAFLETRMIKTPNEIKRIKEACTIVSEMSFEIPSMLKEGITELELAALIDYTMKKKGANKSAFDTIVAFGINTSQPHYGPSNIPLQKNDVILIDFGAEVLNYKSDITQVYFLEKPSKEQTHLYNTVYKAESLAIDMIKDGVTSKETDTEVRKYIDSFSQYKDRFIHGLGHGLGLDVHDHAYPKILKKGMVITVEPGIYLSGLYGARLEDDVIVTENGCELLTNTMKKPIE